MIKKFECKRCGYSTKDKSNLKKHLSRKNECEAIHELIPRIDLINEIYPLKEKNYTCICGQSYFHHQGLSSHQKTCNYKKIKEELKEEFQEELSELKNKVKVLEDNNSSINNINNNSHNNSHNTNSNNTNMIVINSFGSEDLSYITPALLDKCFNQMAQGIFQLTKAIHCNKDHPENQNIKATNIRAPYMQVFKDGEWMYEDKEKILNKVLTNKNNIIREYYEENEDAIREKRTDKKVNQVIEFLDNIDTEENKEALEVMKKEIFMIFKNYCKNIKN